MSEALRLAVELESWPGGFHKEASSELRRLAAENDKLRADLKTAHMDGYEGGKQEARDAAHEEIDALRRELHYANERYMALIKNVADGVAMQPKTVTLVLPDDKLRAALRLSISN